MKFKFGKWKGQTLQAVASVENGKQYLRWYCSQPPMNAKYAEVDKATKESIMAYLKVADGGDIQTVNKDVVNMVGFMDKLNTIDAKLDLLLSRQPMTDEQIQASWEKEENETAE